MPDPNNHSHDCEDHEQCESASGLINALGSLLGGHCPDCGQQRPVFVLVSRVDAKAFLGDGEQLERYLWHMRHRQRRAQAANN